MTNPTPPRAGPGTGRGSGRGVSGSQPDGIKPGATLRVRDVSGRWHERVAASALEGCHVDGRLKHDFAGVYVRRADEPEDAGIFWPLEDVEVVSAA